MFTGHVPAGLTILRGSGLGAGDKDAGLDLESLTRVPPRFFLKSQRRRRRSGRFPCWIFLLSWTIHKAGEGSASGLGFRKILLFVSLVLFSHLTPCCHLTSNFLVAGISWRHGCSVVNEKSIAKSPAMRSSQNKLPSRCIGSQIMRRSRLFPRSCTQA